MQIEWRRWIIALTVIIAGFVSLRTPPVDGFATLTLAPILLLSGFLLLVPFSLWPSPKKIVAADDQNLSTNTGAKNIIGLLIFLFVLMVYIKTLWPGPGWWGSADYIENSIKLGVISPPGSVLFQLLGRMISFLSIIESPAVRVNLVSAAAAAGSATAVYYISLRVINLAGSNNRKDSFSAILGGVVAALALAFIHSLWEKATFANPYPLSLLNGALILYVSLRWWEKPDEPGYDNFLLIIAFLFGLDLSFHRSNILLIPAILFMVALRRPGRMLNMKLWIGCFLTLILGMSLQLFVMFRAQLEPLTNFGNPDNWEKLWGYLSLKQFGIAAFGSDVLQRKGPFWDYQIKEMYLRYLGWNFLGIDRRAIGVNPASFWYLPALAGMAGFLISFIKDRKLASYLFVTFLFASMGAILYLNIPANFFREMDRHYLVSFMLVAIWIGLAIFVLSSKIIRTFGNGETRFGRIIKIAIVLMVLVLPGRMLYANWSGNDMKNNYTAYMFARNMLESCDPNAILFTAGDSDTFPVWYLQRIENIRPDVITINIPLTNATWYLETVLKYFPDLPLVIDRDLVSELNPRPRESDMLTVYVGDSDSLLLPPGTGSMRDYLLVQDQVLINILENNRFQRPVYFSVGFGQNLPLGLEIYSQSEGLLRMVDVGKGGGVNYRQLEENLLHRYDYRGLGEQFFFDRTGRSMTSNYIRSFIELGRHYFQNEMHDEFELLEDRFKQLWPGLGSLEEIVNPGDEQ